MNDLDVASASLDVVSDGGNGVAAPRRYRPAETRRRIIEAAAELFTGKGYDRTSTADISNEAGVAEGSIFYHFGSKRGLLAALGRHFSENMIAAMRADSTDLRDLDTATMIERCFDFNACNPKNSGLMGLHECAPEAEPYFSAGRQVVVAFTEEVIRANIDRVAHPGINIALAASLAFAAVHDSMHRLMQTQDPVEQAAIKRETIRFVKSAIGF